MNRPRALDLFCGAGGVSYGLYLAGFDVVGVDINTQPHYPSTHDAEHAQHFRFEQGNALEYPLEGFDLICASPPCQAHTVLRSLHPDREYPDLIPATRERLRDAEALTCIENVPGAPLGGGDQLIMLCGTMFGLLTPDGRAELRRHRLFELRGFTIALPPACSHRLRALSVTGSTAQINVVRNTVRETFTAAAARAAMGISWMPMKSLSQAIPPAYLEFIGRHALETIVARRTS